MELRPHQKLAVDMLRDSFKSGKRRPLIAAPCGFGKTHLASYLCKQYEESGKKALFIADRVKLIYQTHDAMDQWGVHYGVIQGDHWLVDYAAPTQICSIQTLSKRIEKGYDPNPNLIIVDEAHVTYESTTKIFDMYPNARVVGLSATPYSKGLGLIYDDLIVPATTQSMIDAGYLTPIVYYGGAKANLKGVKSISLPTGGTDYHPKALEEAYDQQKEVLTGSIIENWVKHAGGKKTVAFASSIAYSKFLANMFCEHGIPAAHVDGYMDLSQREKLFAAHDSGEILILSCSKLLGVGWDSPKTEVLLDCRPTKSKIAFQQIAGRIIRMAEGKTQAIYLDHAGNVTERHGFVESLVPSQLSTDEKRFKESNQIKEKKEKEPRECPECHRIMTGIKCVCGFVYERKDELTTTQEMLVRINKGNATPEDRVYMGRFYSSLLRLSRKWNFKDGWAAYAYKKRFGRFPRSVNIDMSQPILAEAQAWANASLIKFGKRRK